MKTATWEGPLLSLAYQARYPGITTSQPIHNAALLERAYAHCEALTSLHSQSFFLATRFLPRKKRRAMHALYAFCRITDDIVDGVTEGDIKFRLAAWRRRALAPDPPPDDLVATAWADTRAHYGIPSCYAEQLIEGVQRDLHQKRYDSFAELAAYCYGAASTVGLMSMYIINFAGITAIPYAIRLGVALQLTNILRDIAEDWQAGRVYLPADELVAFGLRESDLARGEVDDRWRAFMRFQIDRNRQLYAQAWPGIGLLHPDGRFAVAAAAGIYRAILGEIEAHDYDVFHNRAHVSAWGKLRRLPGLWLNTHGAAGWL